MPTAMLPDEQVGWMFHRVCMKEASTWVLPLEIERCCKREAGYIRGVRQKAGHCQ